MKDTPLDENAALQWAVDTFRRNAGSLKSGGHPGRLPLNVKYHPGTPIEAVELSYEEHAELIYYNEILAIAENARDGHEGAGRLLSEIAARLIEQSDPLPAPLKEFVIEALRHPRQRRGRGRSRFEFTQRNHWICFAITMINLRWKFPATRNDATERASAASIVQEALRQVDIRLKESAVTKIWNGTASGGWKKSRKQMSAFK